MSISKIKSFFNPMMVFQLEHMLENYIDEESIYKKVEGFG